jgi:hypothetical protein
MFGNNFSFYTLMGKLCQLLSQKTTPAWIGLRAKKQGDYPLWGLDILYWQMYSI